MAAVRRLVVDVSNITVHPKKLVRTGIQEVVYQTLIHLPQVRSLFPDWEILLLPEIPRKFGGGRDIGAVPYPETPKHLFPEIEANLGLSSRELWGFDYAALDYTLGETKSIQMMAEAEAVHIQGLVDVGPLGKALERLASTRSARLSLTVYDLIPVLFPEYCPPGIARWYEARYLPSLGKAVAHAVCISHNTALDLRVHPNSASVPRVSVLPLPLEVQAVDDGLAKALLQKFGLRRGAFIVSLGSLEPRKNVLAAVDGFEAYRRLHPESDLKLVLVGSTGWKNSGIDRRIWHSEFSDSILKTGYLEDADLGSLLSTSLALIMLAQYEGYGLPVAQAVALGVPAITTLGSSLPEACRGEALFVAPDNPVNVAAAINLLVTARGQRKDVRKSGKNESRGWGEYCRELVETLTHY